MTYSDAMTALTWFVSYLMFTTLLCLAWHAIARHGRAAYLATLMSWKERRRR